MSRAPCDMMARNDGLVGFVCQPALRSLRHTLRLDLDEWMAVYNEQRTHQGRWCFGKTPMQTFLNAIPIAKEKMIAA